MKKYATRTELKAQARGMLLGHYLPLAGAFLSLTLLQYIITIPPELSQLQAPLGPILYLGANFLLQLFFGIFNVGLAFLFLSNACGQPVYASGIFAGFWHNPLKAMQIQLVPSLLLLLPTALSNFLLLQWYFTNDSQFLEWTLIATLVFLPYQLFVQILYSQSWYIMLDFPEMTAMECLRYSRRLMKGQKFRYLLLDLSFLPMTFLGFLTCGVGLLYVTPYREQTFANFYLDLIQNNTAPAER